MTKPMPGIFSSPYRAPTIGVLTAITACAFDQTAVTAVMPTITESFGSTSAYSATFVVTLAASIIGMVASGIVTDRRGARISLLTGAGIFMVGLLLSVISTNIETFLASRAIQGLGTGSLIVAIYAAIASLYPEQLRAKVFAAFSAAWVVPSLIGPGFAGLLTVTFSWHAVFWVATIAIAAAILLLAKPLTALSAPEPRSSEGLFARAFTALVLAATVALMNYSAQLHAPLSIALFVATLAAALVCARSLLPPGTLRGRAKVPRLVLTRGFVDMFFAAESYLPLVLATLYGFGPTRTGIALTVSGLTWFLGSQLQSRYGPRFSTPAVASISTGLLAVGLLVVTATIFGHWAWWLAVAGWGVSASGMGFFYPRLSSEPLNLCDPNETGFVGSALQISGTLGMTCMLSLVAIIQVGAHTVDNSLRFGIIFAVITSATIPLFILWSRKA